MASLATPTLRIIVLDPPLCCIAVLPETRSSPGIKPVQAGDTSYAEQYIAQRTSAACERRSVTEDEYKCRAWSSLDDPVR